MGWRAERGFALLSLLFAPLRLGRQLALPLGGLLPFPFHRLLCCDLVTLVGRHLVPSTRTRRAHTSQTHLTHSRTHENKYKVQHYSLHTEVTDTDLRQGTVATYNVLEAMRLSGTPRISFSSSSAVYGEADLMPTPESYGPIMPISLRRASASPS